MVTLFTCGFIPSCLDSYSGLNCSDWIEESTTRISSSRIPPFPFCQLLSECQVVSLFSLDSYSLLDCFHVPRGSDGRLTNSGLFQTSHSPMFLLPLVSPPKQNRLNRFIVLPILTSGVAPMAYFSVWRERRNKSPVPPIDHNTYRINRGGRRSRSFDHVYSLCPKTKMAPSLDKLHRARVSLY